jgi:hypothetical protein
LKLIDDDWKRQPTKFWKYVSTFRKSNSTLIQLHVDGTCIDDPNVAEAFAKHFYTSCSRISPPLSSILAYFSDFLPLAPISALDIQKAVKRLITTKSVGPPKGCKVSACLNACHPSNAYLPLRGCLPPNGSLPASDCLPARSCLPAPACLPASGCLTERQRRPANRCLPPRDRLPTIIWQLGAVGQWLQAKQRLTASNSLLESQWLPDNNCIHGSQQLQTCQTAAAIKRLPASRTAADI